MPVDDPMFVTMTTPDGRVVQIPRNIADRFAAPAPRIEAGPVTMLPPAPPAGPQLAPSNAGPDHMLKVLTEKYGLSLPEALAYSQKLESGAQIPGGKEIQGEAMQALADQEQRRVARISYYADVARKHAQGQPLTAQERTYLDAVQAKQRDLVKQQAKQAVVEQSTKPAHQSYGISTEPDAKTMDPVLRETARMQNMTDWGQQTASNPDLNRNWTYDGFTMRLKPTPDTLAPPTGYLAGTLGGAPPAPDPAPTGYLASALPGSR